MFICEFHSIRTADGGLVECPHLQLRGYINEPHHTSSCKQTHTTTSTAKQTKSNIEKMGVSKVAVAVAVVLMVAVIERAAVVESITCGQVTGSVGSCLGYLKTGGKPVPACCNGVRGLNSLARTPADRKQACNCLKTLAGSVKGINYGFASALPGKCGISIPYPISPNTDCAK